MHPIYALWSHPRSMSTAMERVMRERGDLDCAHEPFMYDYYVHRQVRVMPHFDIQPDHPTDYAGIRDMLLARAARGPVFIKDMSYYVWPQVTADPLITPHLVNMFLVRDPVASIASYFKLDPDLISEEIGIHAQWQHYQALCEQGPPPPVVDANDIRADTRGVISALWKQVGLPHIEAAFEWQSDTPKDWQQVEGWHGKATSTNTIQPLTAEELARQRARFDEMAATSPRLTELLAQHQPYYEKFRERALKP